MMVDVQVQHRVSDYKSDVRPIWCPGCGDFGVLSAFYKALVELNLPPEKVAIASGIGCSGRLPAFVHAYGYHGVHGRALPLAAGIKMGNPELTVFAMSGDGDAFSIGAGHLQHAVRRNVDITYIVMDNQIYGLTKGQPSPTSPTGTKRKASPYGTLERPIRPVAVMLGYGCSFVARGFSSNPRHLTELIVEAVRHPGFSFIEVMSPCVTFNDIYAQFKERLTPVPEDHDPGDRVAALRLAFDPDHLYQGILYKDDSPGYVDGMFNLRKRAGRADLRALIDQFRVAG
jgi:2-oxoglutarate ferredoxin oxidoreductase subunit beta